MAETLTTKFGLKQYGAGTDTFGRTEYNADNAAMESAAKDEQGALGSRPAAGISGRWWYDTGTGVMYRDNGSAWTVIGSKALDAIFTSSATSTVPLTASGVTSQTEDIFRATVAAAVRARIKADGTFNTVAGLEGANAVITGAVAATTPLIAKGAASQSADLLKLQNNSSTDLFRVTNTGGVTSSYLVTGDGTGVIGKNSASSVANMAAFSGTPALEVTAKGGGAGSTFTDFLYLKHEAANGNAVLRRLGMLMKIGDEIGGDATKSGAMYIESSAANAGSPSLILERGNAPVLTFPASGAATLAQALSVTGTVSATPSSAAHYNVGTGSIGQQGDNTYIRTGSATSGLYVYAAGSYNATPGNAGGGVLLAQLLRSGSEGLLTTTRGYFNAASSSSNPASSPNPVARFGPSSGVHINIDEYTIQAGNNNAAALLRLNPHGGQVDLGNSGATVSFIGRPVIDGKKVTIATSAPSSPGIGDIWIDV